MVGTYSKNFNEQELQIINQLRERVSDIIDIEFEKTDTYLSKWLLISRYDVSIAEKCFRAHKTWRKVNNIDGILSEDLSEVENRFPISIDGMDRTGCPLMVIHLGGFELKKFLEAGGREQFLRYVIQKFERANLTTRKQYISTGGSFHQLVGILDFDGFSLLQLTSPTLMSVAIEFAKIIEANYPCCCKSVNAVNAPRVVKILMATVKPFLSDDSASRIKIFDSNGTKWKAALLETISPEQLPIHMGGTKNTKPS